MKILVKNKMTCYYARKKVRNNELYSYLRTKRRGSKWKEVQKS